MHDLPRSDMPAPGRALVRFEMANLLRTRHSDASDTISKVVVRVLKIIEPPAPEDAEAASRFFEEGRLVQRYSFRTGTTGEPWSTTRQGEDRLIPLGANRWRGPICVEQMALVEWE